MLLNYLHSGSGKPLIILHGLFGMLDNWKSVGKELEKKYAVYLVDQRNHGRSPQVPEHSYKAMAADLAEFFEQQHLSSAYLLGHSMGGKTAMQFALDHSSKVDKLIVVDMGIRRYGAGHDAIFETLNAIDLKEIHYRSDAEKILLENINDFGTRQFILKNLVRQQDGSYTWRFNLEALDKNYESEILAPVDGDHPYTGPTLFIRGQNSGYILNEDWDGIQQLFPNSKLMTVKNAGHWVHADQPAEIVRLTNDFLAT